MNATLAGPSPRRTVRYAALARDPLAAYVALYRDFGDTVRVPYAPGRAFYLLSRPEHAEQVLVANQDAYAKAFTYRPLRAVLGTGSLTSEGDTWRRHRRLVQPVFAHRNVVGFAGEIVDAVRRRTRTWPAGEPIDVMAEMRALTMDIVGRVLFGTDLTDDAARIGRALAVTQRSAMIGMLLPQPGSSRSHRGVLARVPRVGRAVATLDDLAGRTIAERRGSTRPEQPDTLLDLMIAGHDGYRLDDEELRDEVITLMLAGHETTATALTWTLMLLSQHPAVRERVEVEVDEVLAGRDPTADDLDNLVWTQAAHSESMRLYPPAWTIERDALRDHTIGDVEVARGSTVVISPYLMHRHPDVWPNPEGFQPERFLPEAVRARPKHAYLPFGGGRRICVGASFASLEAGLVLATLAGSCRLDLQAGVRPAPRAEVTLHPDGPVPMMVGSRGA